MLLEQIWETFIIKQYNNRGNQPNPDIGSAVSMTKPQSTKLHLMIIKQFQQIYQNNRFTIVNMYA